RQQFLVFGAAAAQDAAAAIEPQDTGRALEGAEHQRQASIRPQMGCRFVAAAGEVEIGHIAVAEHSQGIGASGRHVDPAVTSGGGGEEYLLAPDEVAMAWSDAGELLGHAAAYPTASR